MAARKIGGNMTRHETREAAFKLIFAGELSKEESSEIIEAAQESESLELNAPAIELFRNVREKSSELDEIIAGYSKKRAVSRIPKASLAILRLALYEIKYDDNVPTSVAINEAVVIAKEYCDEADVSFINGVLGSYSRAEAE